SPLPAAPTCVIFRSPPSPPVMSAPTSRSGTGQTRPLNDCLPYFVLTRAVQHGIARAAAAVDGRWRSHHDGDDRHLAGEGPHDPDQSHDADPARKDGPVAGGGRLLR